MEGVAFLCSKMCIGLILSKSETNFYKSYLFFSSNNNFPNSKGLGLSFYISGKIINSTKSSDEIIKLSSKS